MWHLGEPRDLRETIPKWATMSTVAVAPPPPISPWLRGLLFL